MSLTTLTPPSPSFGEPQRHNPVIPLIGAVKGYVAKKDIEIGEAARKFGRTTGYTEGRIFSSIWIFGFDMTAPGSRHFSRISS